MIDRFTEQAREAIGMAVEAAEELGHSYVGTEHLLIGLLREKSGVAARVLEDCGVRVEKVTELINQLIAPNQSVGMAERVLRQGSEQGGSFRCLCGALGGQEHCGGRSGPQG